MAQSRQPFGQRGEQLAARYLQARGYIIVATNWRCRSGEIDIVAQQADLLVFVEVRTRHAALPETAFESISERKRARLVRAVHVYLAQHRLDDMGWRMDVIAIAVPPNGEPILEHRQDAFEW